MTPQEMQKLADDLDAEFTQGRISNHNGRKAAAEIRLLLDRLEKAEKDAGRYRWLRDRHDTSDTFWHVRGSSGDPVLSGRLDIAIDTAMEASK
jgi:hypothetical protein